MGVPTSTERATITQALDAALLADPVRNTVLGSIRAALTRPDGAGWCAASGSALAVRGRRSTPVALTEGWTNPAPLADALRTLPDLQGIGGPVPVVDSLLTLLAREPQSVMSERLFRLDALQPPRPVAGAARIAVDADVDLLTEWYTTFTIEVFGRIPTGYVPRADVERGIGWSGAWLWCEPDGVPVALAHRHPPACGVSRIGPVYTPPHLRERGFGSAITAAVSAAVLAEGVLPVLYTDLANPTSNRIYRQLGYRPVTDRTVVTFC